MKKSSFHFNAVDVILSLVIIAVVLFLFNGALASNHKVDFGKKQNIQMTVKVYDVPAEMQGKIFRNDTVRSLEDSTVIGTVKAPITYTKQYEVEYNDGDDKKTYYTYADLQEVKFDIECQAVSDGEGFIISDKKYSVSDSFEFYVPGFSGKATITSIEVIK